MTTCLVGHTPLRLLLLLLLRNDDKPTRKLATNLAGAFASEPSHRTGHRDYTGHQDYQPPTLTTDYFARPTNGNRSLTGISHLVTNIGLFPLPFMYNPVQVDRCEANLATKLHRYRCQVSWKYYYYFEFCLYSLFLQYTPNY